MEVKKNISSSRTPSFFSKEMIITKKSLNENQLKFTYQKQLISDLDYKHKEWSKSIDSKFKNFRGLYLKVYFFYLYFSLPNEVLLHH